MYRYTTRASDSAIWFMFIHGIGGSAVRRCIRATH